MQWLRKVTVIAGMMATVLAVGSQAAAGTNSGSEPAIAASSNTQTTIAAAVVMELRSYNGIIFKCLAVGGASEANGAPVVQWDCGYDSDTERQWFWNGKRIVNVNSGKCLAIGDASSAKGARAIQWTCNGGSEQNWWQVSAGAGRGWLLRNEHSGLYLSVAENGVHNGAWVVQWTGTGGSEQQWEEYHR